MVCEVSVHVTCKVCGTYVCMVCTCVYCEGENVCVCGVCHMCVCATCICVEERRVSDSLFYQFLSFAFRQGLSLSLELTVFN